MLPSRQQWLLTRLRYLLEKREAISKKDAFFDAIRHYLNNRHRAYVAVKKELLFEIKSVNRTDFNHRNKFYTRLQRRVNQQVPFPITSPYLGIPVEELYEIANLMDEITLHQDPDKIREALLLPRNKHRDIHQEITHLFNPERIEETKQIASYAHVLSSGAFSIFLNSLKRTFFEVNAVNLEQIAINFSDQTHQITVRFSHDKGWELTNITQGEPKYYDDEQIAEKIIEALPYSRQEPFLLFSCQFHSPSKLAHKVGVCLSIWRQTSTMRALSQPTYETANFKADGNSLSWLALAVEAQEIKKIIELLGHIENWSDYASLFPAILHLAIRENQIGLVKSLLEKGLSVDCIHEGRNPFHLAAAYGRVEILDLLVAYAPREHLSKIMNSYDEEGYTPLAIAVEENSRAMQKLLSYPQILPNAPCKNTKTPLSIAVGNQNLDGVLMLLNSRANPNIHFDSENRTPLHLAVMVQNSKLVKILCLYGAKIQTTFSRKGKEITTLALANSMHDKSIARFLAAEMNYSPQREKSIDKAELLEIIDTLIDNIANQKNGRITDWYSHWKIERFATLRNRLQKEQGLTPREEQQYIDQIREICAARRNFFHFWSQPHSVNEFENLLEQKSIAINATVG